MGDKIYRWWIAAHEDSELYGGPFDTREQAVAAGTSEYDGEPFWLIEADKSVVRPSISADRIAERIIEDLCEKNEECWGEDGPDDPWSEDDVRDLEHAIDRMVADWLAAHPAATFSVDDTRSFEQFDPAAVS